MEQDSILEIKDLSIHFASRSGLVRAVNDLDLTVKAGTTMGIVGESGCGKSMTARAILQIIPRPGEIVSGSVCWRRPSGEVIDLAKVSPKDNVLHTVRGGEIGMIFQEPMSSLSPVYTVGNQLTETIRLHRPEMSKKELHQRAIDLLDLVGLPNPQQQMDTYPFQLSGGMCQRAMIAIALSCDPSLLIADEPTTALDVTIQAQILDLLQKLQDELDMSIIIISHDLGVVSEVSDRVAVMYLGRVVEQATTKEIFTNPKHPYTVGLMKSVPQPVAGKRVPLYSIRGRVPPPYMEVPGCPFHPRCSEFIPGECDKREPPNIDVSAGHEVRCLLFDREGVLA